MAQKGSLLNRLTLERPPAAILAKPPRALLWSAVVDLRGCEAKDVAPVDPTCLDRSHEIFQ
jgi:hypothetical protein